MEAEQCILSPTDEAAAKKEAISILDEVVHPDDVKMYEELYRKHRSSEEEMPKEVQFQYAMCLARTTCDTSLNTGAKILEDIYHKSNDKATKRDALYYLAVANARLKNYDQAVKYCQGILYVEPEDKQTAELKKEIDRRMLNDGLMGIAVIAGVGAAALGGLATVGLALGKAAVGGIISLGIAFTKRH